MPDKARASTIAYFAAFIALGLSVAALGPALPSLAKQTQTGLGQISFVFTASSLGYLLGSLGGGRAFDRLPGNRLLALVLLVMSVALALTPLASQLWWLVLLLMLLGAAEASLDVGANLLLVWIHRSRANPYLNALHFFYGVGALLSPILIARSVLASGGISWALWALALYPLPLAVWLFTLPGPTAPKAIQGEEEAPVNWTLVLLIALVFFFYVGAEASFGGWIYTYSLALELTDICGAGYLTALFWGALTVGRLLGVPLATRFQPSAILWADLIGCLASLVVILLFPGSTMAVWIGALGLGLFMASIFPTLLALAGRSMTLTGNVMRWFFVATGAGGMVLPWLIGILAEQRGPQITMPLILIDLGLALAAFQVTLLLCSRLSRGSDV